MDQFLKDSPSDFTSVDERTFARNSANALEENLNDLPNFVYNPLQLDLNENKSPQDTNKQLENELQNTEAYFNFDLNKPGSEIDELNYTSNDGKNNLLKFDNSSNSANDYDDTQNSSNVYDNNFGNTSSTTAPNASNAPNATAATAATVDAVDAVGSVSGFPMQQQAEFGETNLDAQLENNNESTLEAGGDYLSPMGFTYSQQPQQRANLNYQQPLQLQPQQPQQFQQPQQPQQTQRPIQRQQPQQFRQSQQEFSTDSNQFLNSNPGSFTNEPFLDDMAFSQAILGPQLNSPPFEASAKQSSSPQPISPLLQSSQAYINPINSTNLDELISPGKNFEDTSYLSPQYFSPPNKAGAHFNSLRSIAEHGGFDQNTANSNMFSPNISRHGSISGPGAYSDAAQIPQQLLSNQQPGNNTYLSPQLDPLSYVSPDFYGGSYLNSPPPNDRTYRANLYDPGPTNAISTSIPNHGFKQENWGALSPPPTQSSILSTSVPGKSSQSTSTRDSTHLSVPTKQLSKEEKLKRRREFHNAVERRRRDLIKERIKELGIIVPPSLLNPQLCAVQTLQRKNSVESNDLSDLIGSIKVKDTKPNKSAILNKSVVYMNHLNYVLQQQQKTREDLTRQIESLEAELSYL